MVYDCVMFNDELDILELRLEYMNEYVDHFVIGESSLTHSNQSKSLFFKENAEKFARFSHKILYVEVPPIPQKDSWEGEFYQRNYLKNALLSCKDDDIIIIADIDELVNLEYILKNTSVSGPMLIEMQMYYYFFNLKTSITWLRTLISPYKYLKNFDIGDRLKYTELNPQILKKTDTPLGWHFSYLFGWNIDLYISKLKSFSHQEFNTPYYLDDRRIKTCLQLGIDFLERYSIYERVELKNEVTPALYNVIRNVFPMEKYLHQNTGISFYFNTYRLKYYLKFVFKLKLSIKINVLFGPRND